ncbi:MAG: hypothetical protein GF383_14740 [Candidatus Lokiarchaeota archaeon]|nr:hypothetical protein [Candidatus Lokiarchaeota archaeon]MBD3342673.1 hypothetical protein [Candidatus Lokiarchaeota archaeon]
MRILKELVNQEDLNSFLGQIKNVFPNFVAGVLCDRNGFPIASKAVDNFHIHENHLALAAIKEDDSYIKTDSNYMKVMRALDKTKNVRLYLLLEKSYDYINRFKQLKSIIENQTLF